MTGAAVSSPTSTAAPDQWTSDLRLACMRLSRRVRFESVDAIAPHQFSAMCRIRDGARTPREVAESERVSAPSMTRTVAGLVERGLLQRAPDPGDGRQVLLSLTPGGVRVFDETRRRRDEWLAGRLAVLDDDERETLRRATTILTRVVSQ